MPVKISAELAGLTWADLRVFVSLGDHYGIPDDATVQLADDCYCSEDTALAFTTPVEGRG